MLQMQHKFRMTQKEINNILEELNNGKFHIECPSCYEEVNLKELDCFIWINSAKKPSWFIK